jgi:hypothetical protein
MGLPDLYPFVLSPAVVAKLGFIHELIRTAAREGERDVDGNSNQFSRLAPA